MTQEQRPPQRKLRLGAFIMATGHHIAAWRHPGAQADAGVNIDHYIELAQTAERGAERAGRLPPPDRRTATAPEPEPTQAAAVGR